MTTTPAHSLRRTGACLLLAAAAGCGALAHAADETPLPRMKTEGPLQYSCGGIGSDESTAMRAAMKDYPLSLLFSRKDGEYLANLAVAVQGGKNTMEFTASGPICLLKLAPGRYTVTATTQDGQRQSQTVTVQQHGHTLDFRY